MSAASNGETNDALNPRGSAWVGANAGAGKTYILVSRLARLMLDGVKPERLLCLTYTRAAAAEMQVRLFDLLAEWALLDDAKLRAAIEKRLDIQIDAETLHRARILFAQAMETPGGLRLQTIHGFCESLLKRFPLEAGLSPHFDLMDEQDAQTLQSTVMSDLLLRAQTPTRAAALAVLTRALAENDIMALGRQIISQSSRFDRARASDNLDALASAMGLDDLRDPGGALPPIAAPIKQVSLDIVATAQMAQNWYENGGVNDQKQAVRLSTWLAMFQSDPQNITEETAEAAWPYLREVFFTQNGNLRAQLYSAALANEAPEHAEAMDAAQAKIGHVDERVKALTNHQLSAALYDFADALLSGYEAEKTRRGVLDYDDLVSMTNQLLSGAGAAQWVLFKIDNGLEHILVDEAQDTSPAQWRVITALADAFFDDAGLSAKDKRPRTIFAVGDEKQSIFSFQGADPTGFAARRDYFEQAITAIGGQFSYVAMTRSWRSTPQILKAVDLVFADNANRQGLTADGQAVEHIAERAKSIGHVDIWPALATPRDDRTLEAWQIPDTAERGGRNRLARKIADKINDLLNDAPQNISAGDILVLVRKRDAFVPELSRALKRLDINVAGADRMVLLEQLAVADILAALDIALNPSDDMAVAIFLRSPLGGIDETGLFDLAHDRKANLFDAVRDAAKIKGNSAVQTAYQRLDWLRRQCDFLSPYELLAQFLGAQGAHKLLSRRLGPEIDDPLGELLRLALAYEARHAASLQGFVHWLRQGSQDIKRDMEAGGDAVRIMTVHGAKGLEAPIVFLPDTCRPAIRRGGSGDRMQFGADGDLPLWRASQALRDSYNAAQVEAADQAAREEEKRLLYVAMTRARDRLYISGWLQKGHKHPPTDSWYAMLNETLDETARDDLAAGEMPLPNQNEDEDQDRNQDMTGAEADRTIRVLPPPPDWLYEKPAGSASSGITGHDYVGNKIFSPSGLSQRDDDDEAAGLGSAGFNDEAMRVAAERGRLAHRLLETLPLYDAARRPELARSYLSRHMDALDETLIAQIMAVIQDAELADLFSDAALAEAPIAGFLTRHDGSRLALSGQIDRLVETEKAILLVDFKTGRPPEDTQGGNYLAQMAAYRGLMQAAQSGDKPVECALVWTQNGRIDWLDTALLDDALDKILSSKTK